MKINIFVGTIDHNHGRNIYVGPTSQHVADQIADFCREWAATEDVTLNDDMTTDEVIDTYFEACYHDESYLIDGPVELEIQPTKETT
ncbi:hypothetical protein [Rhizobium arsenicireducens]